jgi:undecaprenyl diphosphate synthase
MESKVTPRHVAIIMDGNGRWAEERGLPRIAGHTAGIEAIRDVVKASAELGIHYLSLYTFSSENWQRPSAEVRFLMRLLRDTLRDEVDELNRSNVKLLAIGRMDDLPSEARDELLRAMALTAKNDGLKVVLALSYGGRNEILDAVRSIAEDLSQNRLSPSEIDEECFKEHLYVPDLPDPDLLIRTSGEMRISNFLLWQIAYTELWVTPVLWPDFRQEDLVQALKEYERRERRFGRV